jgi:hypothetical protein
VLGLQKHATLKFCGLSLWVSIGFIAVAEVAGGGSRWLLNKATAKLRINPRKSWYWNLDQVTRADDYEVTFHLKQPQPAFVALRRKRSLVRE